MGPTEVTKETTARETQGNAIATGGRHAVKIDWTLNEYMY